MNWGKIYINKREANIGDDRYRYIGIVREQNWLGCHGNAKRSCCFKTKIRDCKMSSALVI